ncbi:unnamed protein product [Effrenium voratum]|nr:unnamed protein product [Effrenium voratum]
MVATCRGFFSFGDTFLESEVDAEASISSKVWEQARLKTIKGEVFLDYTKVSAALAASALKRRFSGNLPEPLALDLSPPTPSSPSNYNRTFSDWTKDSSWVGKTMKEWTKEGPPPNHRPTWKKGDGAGLQVRCGPDYHNKRRHMETKKGHLYHTLTVDSIRSAEPLHSIVGSVVDGVPPKSPDSIWTSECPLPRVLCINVMLPHYNPKNPWAAETGGCSYVAFFEISNETVTQVQSDSPPASVRMFLRFYEGPAGPPGCSLDHPDRNAGRRRDISKRKDMDPGLLRAAGWCLNQGELGVPEFLHQFNGKSFVISESGYVIKDPQGEWLEVGFDVRKFPFLFVDVLYNFRDFVPKAKCHYGFTVQAVDDEDLPEGIICDVYMSGINIVDDPFEVEAGRTGRLPHPFGKSVLIAHGRELAKVTHGMMGEMGIRDWTPLGWGSPSLRDVASLSSQQRTEQSWVGNLHSEEEKKRRSSEAGARLDAALGAPVRRLRRKPREVQM